MINTTMFARFHFRDGACGLCCCLLSVQLAKVFPSAIFILVSHWCAISCVVVIVSVRLCVVVVVVWRVHRVVQGIAEKERKETTCRPFRFPQSLVASSW